MDAHFALSYVTSTFGELKGRHHRLHVARTPVTAPRTSGARAVPRIWRNSQQALQDVDPEGTYILRRQRWSMHCSFYIRSTPSGSRQSSVMEEKGRGELDTIATEEENAIR